MNIEQRGHDGNYTLIASDGLPAVKYKKYTTFRGETVQLVGGSAPHKPGSTGRVHVIREGTDYDTEYFPSVINCRWEK